MPDLIAAFNNLITSQQSAYVAGLIAAFTPCTLAIIPIFLYRFGIWDLKPEAGKTPFKAVLRDVGLLVLGFLISFALAGLLLQNLLTSQLVNVTRLFLGYSLVLIGILQVSGRLSLQFMNRFTNPLLIGLVTPWIISLSPCVLPYFAGLVLTSVTGDTLVKFILFGLGVLTPALMLSLAGNRLLSVFRKLTQKLAVIERWAALLIIFSGIYIAAELLSVTRSDIIIAGILAAVEITIVGILILKQARRRTVLNYSLLGGLLIADLIITIYLAAQAGMVTVAGIELIHACNGSKMDCPLCVTAAVLFIGVAAGLAVTYLLSERKGKQVRFTL